MGRYLLLSATSTIGQATARLLQQEGHTLFLTSRSAEKIQPLAQLTQSPYAIVDPKDFDQVQKVCQEAQEKLNGLDGAVCFSGSLLLKSAHTTSYNEYLETIHASLTSSFALVRGVAPLLNQGGSIVLLSSAASLEGLAFHEAIAAAKGGINSLTLSAASTYASKKIRVNAVAPGLIQTSLTAPLLANADTLHLSEKMHPLGRLGKPLDVAKAIAFLLDTENDWITGQILAVDGGLSRIKKGS